MSRSLTRRRRLAWMHASRHLQASLPHPPLTFSSVTHSQCRRRWPARLRGLGFCLAAAACSAAVPPSFRGCVPLNVPVSCGERRATLQHLAPWHNCRHPAAPPPPPEGPPPRCPSNVDALQRCVQPCRGPHILPWAAPRSHDSRPLLHALPCLSCAGNSAGRGCVGAPGPDQRPGGEVLLAHPARLPGAEAR